MLVGLALQGIKEVQLVHLGIEKVVLRLLHAEHEGRVGHIDVHLLNHQSLGALTAVLVGTLAVALILPFALTFTLLLIALPDIRHNSVNRLAHRFLSAARRGTEYLHQRSLVLYVVDISEPGFEQMRSQRREDGLRNGRAIDFGCLGDE